MSAFFEERVLSVRHWTERLFSFVTTRDRALRFESGHFTMLGIRVEGKPLLRAYSIASAHYEDHLEFLSIKVPSGPLTSRLQHVKPGDEIIIGRKPTGTLLVDYLRPGKRLHLFATGTGLAPFLSIVRDPNAYDRFEQIVLVHGVRTVDELAYRRLITEELPAHDVLGEVVREKLRYYPTVTREPFPTTARVTHLLAGGKVFDDLGLPAPTPASDRLMLCGSPDMLRDARELLRAGGYAEGSTTAPGDFVVERAFVDQ